MACQSVAAVMDEQALQGLNPNADARYRQRVRHRVIILFEQNPSCEFNQCTAAWGPVGIVEIWSLVVVRLQVFICL